MKKCIKPLEEERIKRQEEMLAKYPKNLPKVEGTDRIVKDSDLIVPLTSSIGSLGSYLLDALLGSAKISKIICPNRGVDGENKQRSINALRGLVISWGSRAQVMRTDLGKHLGLSSRDSAYLVQETSFIIRE